ncbi:hypothetical protein YTPLAS72_22610 [Nitrospira sp.]|nr:hypothetical protein YTPLAS72_22610 [Nitrospira sp.]
MGFVTPEEEWIRKDSPVKFRTALQRAIDVSQGIIKDSALAHFDAVTTGREPFNFTIWRVISFGAWMNRFSIRM